MKQNCNSCVFLEDVVCRVFSQEIKDKENTCCPKYCDTISTCAVCGRKFAEPVPPITFNRKTGQYYPICAECFAHKHECATCNEGHYCDFETNSSPLPKVIQKTAEVEMNGVRQTVQTMVRNEEREKITCKAGCKCWDDEYGCLKSYGTCEKQELNLEYIS